MIVPDGDTRKRAVCDNCGHIHYVNPRVVTGCLPVHEEQVLLCKRAIEPKYGFWTLPAGYLENGETVADGASRETMEEAMARWQRESEKKEEEKQRKLLELKQNPLPVSYTHLTLPTNREV